MGDYEVYRYVQERQRDISAAVRQLQVSHAAGKPARRTKHGNYRFGLLGALIAGVAGNVSRAAGRIERALVVCGAHRG